MRRCLGSEIQTHVKLKLNYLNVSSDCALISVDT